MAQDIEEFLRMAAARKKQQAQAQQAEESQSADEHLPPARLSERRSVLGADVTHASEHSHPDLQPTIKTTVSTADIAEHTSHLGEQVHNRPNVVDSRVQDKFDHDLGQLHKADITAPSIVDHGKGVETTTDISTVLDLIKNPDSLKQAIILKEILDRPKF